MTTIEEETGSSGQDSATDQCAGWIGGSGFRQLASLLARSSVGLPTGLRRGDGAALLVIITFVSITGFGAAIFTGIIRPDPLFLFLGFGFNRPVLVFVLRSEERRVGKE